MQKYFLIFLTLLNSFVSFSQTKKAEEELHTMMNDLKVVGLSVVVVKEQDIIYKSHFGMQDISKEKPINDNTIFRIASISKSFSATAIMRLIDEKKLKLNDDFGKLVGFAVRNPRYPNKIITLKMVLSHTSSINDSQGYFNLDVINPAKDSSWAKCYNDYKP